MKENAPATGEPLYPDVTVSLTEQRGKPVACVALVRRALQKAGHADAAGTFTDEALAGCDEEAIFAVARKYVHVL